MDIKVQLYQVRKNLDDYDNVAYFDYQDMHKRIENFKRNLKSIYTLVYEFNETVNNVQTVKECLDYIERKFKFKQLEDFKASHYLQSPDIIILNDNDWFFYSAYGWIEIE